MSGLASDAKQIVASRLSNELNGIVAAWRRCRVKGRMAESRMT
jgi:hypothetical protein